MSDKGKDEHVHLANIIKGTHAELRKKYKQNAGNCDQIWTEHCKNVEKLQKYASAMHCLATEHWSKNPQTRIDWCHEVLREYFFYGGLRKCLEKDQRRWIRLQQTSPGRMNSHEEELPVSTNSLTANSPIGENKRNKCDATQNGDGFEKRVSLPIEEKIPLLDVGSCFNPFGEFEEFLSVGIDLCPANKDVYQCDFLAVEVSEDDTTYSDDVRVLAHLESPIRYLPKQGYYVIVFSLLLEYLPSAVQRWACCTKAHMLLATNGLLMIITPDSHKQHRNAAMIKDWKIAIESLGFRRWKYVKLEHIHCMAFRKVSKGACEISCDMSEKMYIHQDFLEESETEVSDERSYTEEDELVFKECLEELPLFIDDEYSDS